MLPLGAFEEQLHVNTKLVKYEGVAAICIIVGLSLAKKHDGGAMNVGTWRQSNSAVFIIENRHFEAEIITHTAEFVFIFVDFVE